MRLITAILCMMLLMSACNQGGETTAETPAGGDVTSTETAPEETDATAKTENEMADAQYKTAAGTALKTKTEQFSYVIGINIGENFKRDNLEVELDTMMEGLGDALNGSATLSPEDQQKLMQEFQQMVAEKQKVRDERDQAVNTEAAKQFLEANKNKEGVVTLASGMQYKILTAGEGDAHPAATSKVKVHYRGTLIDGLEFDSSHKRGQPAEFGCNQVIKGWTEALQLMKKGSKWELYIPPELAYGPRAQRQIPANSLLIFEVELLEIL